MIDLLAKNVFSVQCKIIRANQIFHREKKNEETNRHYKSLGNEHTIEIEPTCIFVSINFFHEFLTQLKKTRYFRIVFPE